MGTHEVYAHSGKLGTGLFVIPLLGIPAALALALVYAYIDVYSPIAGVVSILFVIGFAVALGMTLRVVGSFAKVRSAPFMTAAGILCGLVGLYAAWAGFEAALLGKAAKAGEETPGFLELLAAPGAVWELAKLINHHGWYSIKSATPTGGVLWVMWAIEAAIVVVGVAIMAPSGVVDEVFCERCDRWTALAGGPARLGLPEDDATIETLALGGPEAVEALEALPSVGEAAVRLEVELRRCDACAETATYQVKLARQTVDDKGNVGTERKDLTPKYLAPPDAFSRLAALAGRPPTSAPPAGEAPPEDAGDAGA